MRCVSFNTVCSFRYYSNVSFYIAKMRDYFIKRGGIIVPPSTHIPKKINTQGGAFIRNNYVIYGDGKWNAAPCANQETAHFQLTGEKT